MGGFSSQPLTTVLRNPFNPPDPLHPFSKSLSDVDGSNSSKDAGGSDSSTTGDRNLLDEATQTFDAQLSLLPKELQAYQQYSPQYTDLQNQLTNQSLFGDAGKNVSGGLLGTYQAAGTQLQNIQGGLNTQQRQQDISDVQNLGGQAVQAFRTANPNLANVQDALTNRALSATGPISALNGADQVESNASGFNLSPYNQVNSSTINTSQVNPGMNYGSELLLGQTLGELSKGGSLSQAETMGIQNDTLNRFNQSGRANDPSAIAGTALGLDSAQQARLAQRQAAVSNASGLYQQDINTNLQGQMANQSNAYSTQVANQGNLLAAQQSNQAAGLTQQQLGANLATNDANRALQAQQSNQQYNFNTGLANQGAQLNNANYVNNLLGNTANSLQSSQIDPFQAVLGRSGALQSAQSATGQAGAGANYTGSGLFDPFSSYASDLYNTNYNAQQAQQIAAGNNSAATQGATIGAIGTIGGGLLAVF